MEGGSSGIVSREELARGGERETGSRERRDEERRVRVEKRRVERVGRES